MDMSNNVVISGCGSGWVELEEGIRGINNDGKEVN